MPSFDPRSFDSRRFLVLAAGIGAALLVVVHGLSYRAFVPDDTWISLHYARRLIEGHGLTWTGGEHVEAYSNRSTSSSVSAATRR